MSAITRTGKVTGREPAGALKFVILGLGSLRHKSELSVPGTWRARDVDPS